MRYSNSTAGLSLINQRWRKTRLTATLFNNSLNKGWMSETSLLDVLIIIRDCFNRRILCYFVLLVQFKMSDY